MAVEPMIQTSASYTSPLLLPLIGIFVSLTVYHFYQQSRRQTKMGDKIPGPPTIPFLGNAHYFFKKHNHGKLQQILMKVL